MCTHLPFYLTGQSFVHVLACAFVWLCCLFCCLMYYSWTTQSFTDFTHVDFTTCIYHLKLYILSIIANDFKNSTRFGSTHINTCHVLFLLFTGPTFKHLYKPCLVATASFKDLVTVAQENFTNQTADILVE